MESNIPQEIKDKIAEYSCDDLFVKNDVTHGYSLALPEISALKEEVERLKDALEKIANAPAPWGENERKSWVLTAVQIANEAIIKP